MSNKKKRANAPAVGQSVPRPRASGYSDAGASRTRRAMKGFTSVSSSPQEDIDLNNYTLRQRSRMLFMSSSMATSAVQVNRTKVVGTGLVLKSAVNRDVLGISPETAKAWQRNTEAEFSLWAKKARNCDALGLNNFAGLQQLALKSWLMSGDVFPLLKRRPVSPLNPYTLRIHLIEADRISTPHMYSTHFSTDGVVPEGKPGAGHKIHDGVEVDDDGAVVAYWICNNYPKQRLLQKDDEWKRVQVIGEKTGLPNILHVMDSERYEVPQSAADAVAAAHAAGGRVFAVGSTTVRTLETVAAANDGQIVAGKGRSSIFIYPPFRFRAVDAMLTNFHLPQSTLLMMVSALAGRERVLAAYEEAIREGYMLYSYGDCMLIV